MPLPDSASPDSVSLSSPHQALLELRARAEKRRQLVTQAVEHHSPDEMQRLVQELQVHQIELEMQYEELLHVQVEAQTARAEYVDLYDFAPVGYFTLTDTGLIQQLNLYGSRQLGAARQRLVERRFALFVAPASRLDFGQFLARVFRSESTQSCDMVLKRKDGMPFYARLEGLRIEEPAEQPLLPARCRLAVIDTTSRHLATEALAASEARFRKLFTESSDAVVLLQGHHYVDCNAAALRLLGATQREQLVGRPAWAYSPESQPDGRRSIDLVRYIMEQALRTGSMRYDVRMHKATGEAIWVEAVLTPIELGGPTPLIHILWRDVTAARAAEQELRASEARLSLALEASQTVVYDWDFASGLVQCDARSQAAFGYAAVAGPVPLQVMERSFHPSDTANMTTAIEQAIATQAPFAFDYQVIWPDGSVRHLSTAGQPVADAQGRVHGIVGVMRDVTALYAAEEQLRYKSLVLERLLSNMPMTLARFGPDGCILELVGAGLKCLGLADNALAGHNVFAELPTYSAAVHQVLGGEPVSFLAELVAEGQAAAFQNYGFFDEQRQQAVVLAVDVTEAEQQRRQLQAEKDFTESLLDNTVDGILALDRNGCVTAWNAEVARYFGREAAEVLGRPLAHAVPNLDDESYQGVRRALAGERVDRPGRPFPTRSGHYDAHLVPLRNAHEDQPTGVLVIIRDVTERDRLAEEATQLRLRRQQEVLAAIMTTQEVERKRIAEAIHNGLGQMLYATKLSLEGRPGVPAAAAESLSLLNEAIRITRTISFELTPGILEDFGLRTALEELVKRLAPARLPVHLHFANLDQRLRPQVEIAVYRVIQELLNNVMKHASASEVEVHVALETGRLEVSVEDNGRGFEPATLANQPLAGMGLAGVRNRVALLGGQLSIESRLNQGTIVSFELLVDQPLA